MLQKILIAKPGFEATDPNLDDKNKVFDSDLNHLKTAHSDSFTRSLVAYDDLELYYVHGLAYKPMAMAYFRDTANDKWFIAVSDPSALNPRVNVPFNVGIYCDATKVYFRVLNNDTAREIEVKYEIFYEGI